MSSTIGALVTLPTTSELAKRFAKIGDDEYHETFDGLELSLMKGLSDYLGPDGKKVGLDVLSGIIGGILIDFRLTLEDPQVFSEAKIDDYLKALFESDQKVAFCKQLVSMRLEKERNRLFVSRFVR